MKKYTKQLLALLLAICTLVSVAMPTVFATGAEAETPAGDRTPEVSTPASVVYDFYTDALAGKTVREEAAGIKASYDAGTSNWRIEAAQAPGQFRLATDPGQTTNGNNKFVAGSDSLQYFTGPSSGSWVRYFSVRIKSPGTGKFDLTFTHGTSSAGASKGSIYIVDAAVIDAALGADAALYAQQMAEDMYQNAVYKEGIYKYYYDAITAAIKGQTAVTTTNYYTAKATNNVVAQGSFTFEAEKEYVVVFTSDTASSGSNGNIFLGELMATEHTEVPAEPVDYLFYTEEWADKPVGDEVAGIKASYDEGTNNWRYEAAQVPGQFASTGKHIFQAATESLYYHTGPSSGSWLRYIAVRIQSPGAGKFDLTLTHGAGSLGASKGSVYIVDAAVIDGALGENATVYPDKLAEDVVQGGLIKEGIYAEYHAAMKAAIQGKTAVMTADYYSAEAATGATAQGRFTFAAEKEYVVIFTSDTASSGSNGSIYLTKLSAVPATGEEEEPEQPEEPEIPAGPGYTEGVYDFYQGNVAGATLADGVENLAAMYEAGTINWKYEASSGVDLSKATYRAKISSMRVLVGKDRWMAMRIKAPGVDGAYEMKMIHGAGGDGATAGSIYVVPGDTAVSDIFKIAAKGEPAMTTNWFYGEQTSDTIGGRETTTGTVSMRAGEEYIVVFLPTEKSELNSNASYYLGQLQVTRVGEYVEPEGGEEESEYIEYEFYDWENPGQYLYHYKTEEELNKKILADEIAQQYADGTRNWCYQQSNGFASFSTGTPYMSVTIGETNYFCLKIKSPGTGTYEIVYNHMAMKESNAALRGSMFILPYVEGAEYADYKDEANFADIILTTTYSAAATTQQQSTGKYTAFQEGKEYLVCFSVEDNDNSKKKSLKCYPQSLLMKRIGDYVPLSAADYDDGIVYQLFKEQYANKWLTARDGEEYVYPTIEKEYAAGRSNWKFESISGSAKFFGRYLRAGVAKAGKCFAIRIKSPGTGMYKVTLKYMLGFDPDAANLGELYIIEAPEETIPGGSLTNYMVSAPMASNSYSTGGTRFKKASVNGSYGFQEGKEYIVMFYASDASDSSNTSGSTYMYLDRLVMKRTGDYVEPEKVTNQGGVVAEDLIKTFQHGGTLMTTMNGNDYLVFATYGGSLLIYDLDEWRLIDEVDISVAGTPNCMIADQDGRWWIGGNTQGLYCYDPFTREGFYTGKILPGPQVFEISMDEEGYLYFGCSQSKGAYIYRYDPRTLTFTRWQPESWATYVGTTKVKGDYIYTAVSGNDRHEIWKMDKYTGKIVERADVSERFNGGKRYVNGMSWLGDQYLLIVSDHDMTILDIETMELLPQEQINLRGKVSRTASSVIDGKQYFVSDIAGLCYFDLETKTFGEVGGELSNFKTGLRGADKLATIEDSRLSETSIITWGGMNADGLNLYAINLETKSSVTLIGLIDPSMGSGQDSHTLFPGAPGSNEIIYGPMYPQYPARIYNTEKKELTYEMMTNGQNDSYCYYQGNMYFGNYSSAILTRMDGNQATALFRLADDNFNQSRMHTVCGGDNKVFAGTIPNNYNYGGVIAWYDIETGLTYVVTGPNPEDVFYAKASTVTVTNEWYSAVTGEKVDIQAEWDKDQDGDGVCQYFKGPVPMQSIMKLVYTDGLLYGFSTLRPGSGAADPEGMTAQLFVYDVDNFKMLKVFDIRDYIDGLPASLRMLQGLAADPDISNKLWGVVGETLFSFTYDKDTGKVNVKEELSFNKTRFDETGSIAPEMYFEGEYMYVLFSSIGGLCKINRNNPSEYVKLLGDFDTFGQVPTHFVLGEDGDIYYVTGDSKFYVLNVEVTEEELAEAKTVQDAIDLIPEEITLADRDTIFAARAAWDAMDPANQPFVNNFEKLEEAEVALLQHRIDGLGEITIEDEAELKSIRETYIALELKHRMRIDFRKVSDAESIMSVLRAERTSNMINALGEITIEDEAAVRAARASFMDLTRYERTLVKNIEDLNTAEARLTLLLLSRNEAAAVDKKIDEIGFVFFGNSKIKAAKEAYEALSDTAKDFVQKYSDLKTAQIILIAEYVIAGLLVAGGAYITIVSTRKKKVKAE